MFAVVQFEYTTWAQDGKTDMYGKLPSPIAVLTLDQDQTTGKLSLVKYHNVDTSKVHGLWITCGASLSPWGTHLSSEEYEPDAFSIASNAMFQAYSQNLYGDATKANPYHYGHMPEVIVNPDGTGSIKKHFCMGRISHELVQVMPDQRTALMGDDATNSGLFVFVADKEKDLSSGTLYVAKVGSGFSIDPKVGTAAPLTWIKMGSATSAEIENLAAQGADQQIPPPLLEQFPLIKGHARGGDGGHPDPAWRRHAGRALAQANLAAPILLAEGHFGPAVVVPWQYEVDLVPALGAVLVGPELLANRAQGGALHVAMAQAPDLRQGQIGRAHV